VPKGGRFEVGLFTGYCHENLFKHQRPIGKHMIDHPLLPPFLLTGAMSNPLKGCRVSGQVMLTSANLSLLFQGETPT
jgi:hypothetical protein